MGIKSNFTAVVFDFDGTLVDSLGDIVDAMNYVLSERGFPVHSREEYRQLVGRGIADLVERSLPHDRRDTETIGSALAVYKSLYRDRCLIKTRPYPGIVELLEKLKKAGIYMAVLSNKADEFTRYMTDRLFAPGLFDDIVGARDGIPAKPDPGSSLDIAARAGVAPERFIFAGDTGSDMKTACNSGMTPLGVLWGYRDREELENNGARYIVNKPSEILTILGL